MPNYVTTITAGVVSTPFGISGFTNFAGFEIGPYITSSGSTSAHFIDGSQLLAACNFKSGSTFEVGLQFGTPFSVNTGTFTTVTFINPSAVATTFSMASLPFYASGNTSLFAGAPAAGPTFIVGGAGEFVNTSMTTIIFSSPTPTVPPGNGDIVDPEAWQDQSGNIPPLQFSAVPFNTNFPLNGDGRYWFTANAANPNTSGPITFIGNPNYLINTATLQWSVEQVANDGSGLQLCYTADGSTWTTTTLLPQTQLLGIQNGAIDVALLATGSFQVQVFAAGGTSLSTATLSQVAVAITRNANETIQWDAPNPFNPAGYNSLTTDSLVPTDTLANLRSRVMIRLGFSNQAANPPPGMAALVNDFIQSGQKFLYRRYLQLHTKRNFRWKINPGQRFYSLRDNDENVLESVNMDYAKTVEWCGIQDSRNVWYPMIQGIPPQLFTMITKPWRPARYELRGAIEIYPVPDQTYWLWIRGHFGLGAFTLDTQSTTIDSELVFLHALANAKAHYGQPDANNIEAQANAYRLELIAGTHQTAHYVPGTIAVPPAVRPTLIQFDANNGGGA